MWTFFEMYTISFLGTHNLMGSFLLGLEDFAFICALGLELDCWELSNTLYLKVFGLELFLASGLESVILTPLESLTFQSQTQEKHKNMEVFHMI